MQGINIGQHAQVNEVAAILAAEQTTALALPRKRYKARRPVRRMAKPAGYTQHLADRHDGDPADLRARSISDRIAQRLEAGEIIQWAPNMSEPTANNNDDRATRKGA